MGRNDHPVPKTAAKILGPRDREILRFTGQSGVATLHQIHRRFWSQAKLKTCLDRLYQLKRAGWLKRHQVDIREYGEPVYTLTSKGAAQFSYGERRRFIIGLPSPVELKQQLLLQDARILLEEQLASKGHRMLDWRNERELRKIQRLGRTDPDLSFPRANSNKTNQNERYVEIADARVLAVDTEGNEYTLDVEMDGDYYGKMLQKKIAAMAAGSNPVIWVTTPARAERIRLAIQEYSNLSLLVIGDKQ